MYILDLPVRLRNVDPFIHLLIVIIGLVAVGLVISVLLFRILARWSRSSDDIFSKAVVNYLKRPSKFLFPVLCLMLFAPSLSIPYNLAGGFRHVLGIAFIGTLTWMAIRTTGPEFLPIYWVQCFYIWTILFLPELSGKSCKR